MADGLYHAVVAATPQAIADRGRSLLYQARIWIEAEEERRGKRTTVDRIPHLTKSATFTFARLTFYLHRLVIAHDIGQTDSPNGVLTLFDWSGGDAVTNLSVLLRDLVVNRTMAFRAGRTLRPSAHWRQSMLNRFTIDHLRPCRTSRKRHGESIDGPF
jgi:hypothetical protein